MDRPLPGGTSKHLPSLPVPRYLSPGTCSAVPHRTRPYRLPCLCPPPELGAPAGPTAATGVRDCFCRSARRKWSVNKQSGGEAGSRWPGGPGDRLCAGRAQFEVAGRNYTRCFHGAACVQRRALAEQITAVYPGTSPGTSLDPWPPRHAATVAPVASTVLLPHTP